MPPSLANRPHAAVAMAVPLAIVLLGGVALRPRRVTVVGHSMIPALAPGERLLVVRARPRPGRLVVVHDPRTQSRLLVKRVQSVLADSSVEVRGDHTDASTDSRTFGPVAPQAVVGRPVYRYHPPEQAGWLWRA